MKDSNTTTAALEEEPQTVDPMAAADLVAALDRVFRIGVYYPSGHAMCDQAAEEFTRAMGRTLGKAPSLRFEVAGGVLSLQELPLDPELRGVVDFLELMETLGVAAIEMDSNLLPCDLYEFVIGMLAYRNEIKGAREFQQLDRSLACAEEAERVAPDDYQVHFTQATLRLAAGELAEAERQLRWCPPRSGLSWSRRPLLP